MNKPEKAATGQFTLDFEPGLTERYQSLRECVATGVYQRGLGRVAIDLNQAPGNLSVQLSEDQTRHFSIDSLESYIEKPAISRRSITCARSFYPIGRPSRTQRKRNC